MADIAFYLLRQRVGQLTNGEGLVGTPDGGYSTTGFNSADLAAYPDDFFNDWHGRFYAGKDKGTNFEVTDFAKTAGATIFSPALSSAAEAGHKFELYQHFSPLEIGNMINVSISMVEREALIDSVDETLKVLSSTTYEYTVPAGFAFVDEIYLEQSTAGRYSVGENLIDYRHWRVLNSTPSRIWFDPSWVSLVAGRKLRLVGQAVQQQLVDDEDLCAINQAFIVYQAKALLHESRIRGPGSDFEAHSTQMALAQSRADAERVGLRVTATGRKV